VRIKSVFAAPLLLIVVTILLAVSSLVDSSAIGESVSPYLAVIILQFLVYAIPGVFFCRLRGREYTRRLRLRPMRLNHLILLLFALILMISGCALLNLTVFTLFPQTAAVQALQNSSYGIDLYTVLAFCILPAITEEFLFRGIILAEYESVTPGFSACMTALLFALIHLNFARFPAYFFSGLILAAVLYATRSLLAPMIVHGLNNIAALWMDSYMSRASDGSGEYSVLLVFILLCVFFVSLILFFMEAQRIYTDYGITDVPSPHVRRRKRGEPKGILEALIAPPFVLYLLICIIFSVVSFR